MCIKGFDEGELIFKKGKFSVTRKREPYFSVVNTCLVVSFLGKQ